MRNNRRHQGFSLIELNIALFLLLIGFLGITGLILTTINSNNYNRNLNRSDVLTSNMVEIWKSATFREIIAFLGGETSYTYTTDETPDFGGSDIETQIATWRSEVTGSLPSGRGVVTITKQTLGTNLVTATVEVTVQWVQKGAVYHSQKTVYRSDI